MTHTELGATPCLRAVDGMGVEGTDEGCERGLALVILGAAGGPGGAAARYRCSPTGLRSIPNCLMMRRRVTRGLPLNRAVGGRS